MASSIKYRCALLLVCAICNISSKPVPWSCPKENETLCGSKCDYTDWAYDADCRRLSLTVIPRECCMCQTLDLRHNHITVLNDGDFAGYSDITYLDIEMNSMTDISPFAFHGNSRLDTIYAQFNHLNIIHTNNFAGAPNLRQLYLNNNNISEVESGAFDANPNLEVLYLSSNHISNIRSETFQELTKLVYLFIQNNSLSVIQNETFKGLTKLKYLSLGQNKLTNINSQMFEDLRNLRTLQLFLNRIISISLPEFPNLKHLDLFDNDLKTINDLTSYFNSVKHDLEVVYLSRNPLNCSCRLEPLQKWLIHHRGYLGNNPRANATCHDSNMNVNVSLQNENISQSCPIMTQTKPPTLTTTNLPNEYDDTPPTPATPNLPNEYDDTTPILTTTNLPTEYDDTFYKIFLPLAIVSLTFSTLVFCVTIGLGAVRFCKKTHVTQNNKKQEYSKVKQQTTTKPGIGHSHEKHILPTIKYN